MPGTPDDTILDLTDANVANEPPQPQFVPYQGEKQRDWVRATVTLGLLAIFAWVVLWASVESASWSEHWTQTKEMLQVILTPITGLLGTALGFYFGAGGAIDGNKNGNKNP